MSLQHQNSVPVEEIQCRLCNEAEHKDVNVGVADGQIELLIFKQGTTVCVQSQTCNERLSSQERNTASAISVSAPTTHVHVQVPRPSRSSSIYDEIKGGSLLKEEVRMDGGTECRTSAQKTNVHFLCPSSQQST